MTYGQTVAARGPDVAAAEIDRLQRKILAAQKLVDQHSKVSAILFLDEHHWDQPSAAAHWQGWEDYAEQIRSEERRGGKESVSTCRSRWSQYNLKKKEYHTSIVKITSFY